MKKISVLVVLIACIAVAVGADSGKDTGEPASTAAETAFDRNSHALGVFVGSVGGLGLHYQHWFGNVGIQTAFGVFYSPEGDGIDPLFLFGSYAEYDTYEWREPGTELMYYSYYRTRLSYNIGIELLYRLYAEDFANWFSGNLYLFAGINHSGVDQFYYDKKKVEYDYDGGSEYYWVEDPTKKIELGYTPNLSFGVGIGIEPMLFQHFSLPLEFGFGLYWAGVEFDPNAIFIAPIIQAGLRYRFE